MKKQSNFRNPLLASLILLLLFSACFEFDWLVQPVCTNPNSSFTVEVSIITTDGNGGYYIPCFGIRLPEGWEVQDSIEFRYWEQSWYPWFMEGEGEFIHSDSLSAVMDSIDPATNGYYWWVGQGIDTVPYNLGYLFRMTPVIVTDDQTGTFFLDYMAGSNAEGSWGGINWARYDAVHITVEVPDTVTVTSASNAGPGSLREALELAACGGFIDFSIQTTDTIHLSEPLVITGNPHIAGPENGNITISGQSCSRIFHVSKYCNPTIRNINLINGMADNGGAIFMDSCAKPKLCNLSLQNNKAALNGGGMYCETGSHPFISNLTITENFADKGGGIYWKEGSDITMDGENRSDIFFNMAREGNDLYNGFFFSDPINIVLDTFSLLIPGSSQAYPTVLFSFDIQNGKTEIVNADLYVSPSGKNTNSGLSPEEPLKNIDLALSLLYHDDDNPKTIRLMDGVFSYSQTNELFPVVLGAYENMSGTSKDNVILNAEGATAIALTSNNRLSGITINGGAPGLSISWNEKGPVIENITVQNCTESGIRVINSNPLFMNILAKNNLSIYEGGGFHFTDSNPLLVNVLATGNHAPKGGGIYCASSHLDLVNATLAGNTASDNGGAGLYGADSSDINVVNSILFFNDPEEVLLQGVYNPSQIEIANTTVRGGIDGVHVSGTSTVSWLEGNSELDPLFDENVIPLYQLSELSPCIDAGTPDTTGMNLPCWDLLSNKRIWDGNGDGVAVVDMGAFEFGALAVGVMPEEVQGLKFKVQGYPNPTSGLYKIGVTLEEPQCVSWSVFDVRGMLVAEAAEQVLPAGEQNLSLDAGGWPDGLYFCRLRAGNLETTIKLVKAGGN
jgi:parallel beta-helix repeat protein